MSERLSAKEVLKEFLRYALQGKYKGPSIQQIRDDMNKIESCPPQYEINFADAATRYVKIYKLQKKDFLIKLIHKEKKVIKPIQRRVNITQTRRRYKFNSKMGCLT
jgi:hypothetical protein